MRVRNTQVWRPLGRRFRYRLPPKGINTSRAGAASLRMPSSVVGVLAVVFIRYHLGYQTRVTDDT
jgi:hypothetical protein